ncbi:MAG: hypothetical protein AAGA93_00670 [Actinomycetota bacterium]
MPTFNDDLPQEIAHKAVPTEAIVGHLHDDTTVEEFASAMTEAGVEDSRIHVLTGPEGADVLQNLGTPLGRLFSPDRQEPLDLLRSGATLVAVFGVTANDQDHVATTVAQAGAKVIHRFGKWTYS